MSDFSSLGLPPLLQNNLQVLGWQELTPIQAVVIPAALEGSDILGAAPTGTGKSGAFLVPLLAGIISRPAGQSYGLIIEPTRELALQVAEVATALLSGSSQTVGTLIGGQGREEQRSQVFSVLAVTPGRMQEFLRKDWLSLEHIEWVVIDEADRMLDMGFRDEVRSICASLPDKVQTLLFSATLEGFGVRSFAEELLDDPMEFRVGSGEDAQDRLPELLSQRAYFAASDEQRLQILSLLLRTTQGRSLVFVKTRERLSRLSFALQRLQFKHATLQGEQSQNEREAALRRFKNAEVDLLLATDVAARGLDLPEISTVYNYDMPSNAAVYVHRAGRTARAGARGVVVSLVDGEQLELLAGIERYTAAAVERRQMKQVGAAFPSADPQSRGADGEKKRKRSRPGGGFDRKSTSQSEERKHPKVRLRDRKNKGKPDFALKRARKAARQNHSKDQGGDS